MKKFNSNSISRNNTYNGVGGGAGGGTASDIAYDNSLSGLVSQNVQQAIDELHDEIEIGNIYTTDEVRIGEWIDGKPLYRKVITNINMDSVAGSDWRDSNTDAPGINYINCMAGVSGTWFPVSVRNLDNGHFAIMHFRNIGMVITDVILEYTKTTD